MPINLLHEIAHCVFFLSFDFVSIYTFLLSRWLLFFTLCLFLSFVKFCIHSDNCAARELSLWPPRFFSAQIKPFWMKCLSVACPVRLISFELLKFLWEHFNRSFFYYNIVFFPPTLRVFAFESFERFTSHSEYSTFICFTASMTGLNTQTHTLHQPYVNCKQFVILTWTLGFWYHNNEILESQSVFLSGVS